MAICKTLFNEQRSLLNRFYFNQKDNQFIDNEIELVEMFNSHYINIAENMTGIPPDIIPLYDLQENDGYCVKQIIKKFENHPSIVEIKKNIT